MNILPIPRWLILLGFLPHPDVVKAYAKEIKNVLQATRRQAIKLGREHREMLENKTR